MSKSDGSKHGSSHLKAGDRTRFTFEDELRMYQNARLFATPKPKRTVKMPVFNFSIVK